MGALPATDEVTPLRALEGCYFWYSFRNEYQR